jgi:hypothetical protein
MSFVKWIALIGVIWMLLGHIMPSYAVDESFARFTEPEWRNELWLNAGMYSYHYDKSQNFNNNNIGIGAEYRFSTVASLTVGGFKNSDSSHSNYAGIYWQPIAVGPVNIGIVGGGFNGYSSTNNGGWFPAIFPAATIEGKWVGANLFFIPTVGDRVHGAISLQLKLKIID